jgi:hypothetical protein
LGVGNKTIYVKDEALWEAAKNLAGREGLSAVIADALADFVEQKKAERGGFKRFNIYCAEAGPEGQLIKFDGRLLAEVIVPGGPNAEDTLVSMYQTTGGTLVLVAGHPLEDDAFDYSKHSSLETVVKDPMLENLTLSDRDRFLDQIAERLGEKWAVWID